MKGEDLSITEIEQPEVVCKEQPFGRGPPGNFRE